MSSCRALVNHSLYCARVLLEAWQRDREAQHLGASVLQDAYQPALKYHLGRAYGYLLLEGAGHADAPKDTPVSIAELPEPAKGKVLPQTVQAMAREESGILQPLYANLGAQNAGGVRSSLNLAAQSQGPDHRDWHGVYTFLQSSASAIRDVLDEC
ncbi:DUF6586 family protein [Aequoribacter sp.]|uniref:DUF6586 family protein n=1 Tax=Aequoribacter sp. TaxID=2847771 RepID=UPI003C38F3FE